MQYIRYKSSYSRVSSPIQRGWYAENTCPACGRVNTVWKLCEVTSTCKLCGMVQCSGSSGICRFCHSGLLEGYVGHSGSCSYASCDNERAARGKRGKKYVCREHFIHQGGIIPSEIEMGEALYDFSSWKEYGY